jgi:hypothetical protein
MSDWVEIASTMLILSFRRMETGILSFMFVVKINFEDWVLLAATRKLSSRKAALTRRIPPSKIHKSLYFMTILPCQINFGAPPQLSKSGSIRVVALLETNSLENKFQSFPGRWKSHQAGPFGGLITLLGSAPLLPGTYALVAMRIMATPYIFNPAQPGLLYFLAGHLPSKILTRMERSYTETLSANSYLKCKNPMG